MITNSQIKAARALLSWKQSDLANASGLSLATLASLEQGLGSPRPATWIAVTKTLEAEGIEFTDDPGVRLRREKFKFDVLEDYQSILDIWQDIENVTPAGGEVLIAGVDERIWFKKYGDDFKAMLRKRRNSGIVTRHLIAEGDTLLTSPPKFYRAIPKYLFQQTPYYVYADRMVIINWGPPQTVLRIQNPLIAETFRNQFEFNWDLGKKLDPKKAVIAAID